MEQRDGVGIREGLGAIKHLFSVLIFHRFNFGQRVGTRVDLGFGSGVVMLKYEFWLGVRLWMGLGLGLGFGIGLGLRLGQRLGVKERGCASVIRDNIWGVRVWDTRIPNSNP